MGYVGVGWGECANPNAKDFDLLGIIAFSPTYTLL